MHPDWLEIRRGTAPLIISLPHTGTDMPADLTGRYVSEWLAQRDADWWVHRLYDFASRLDATTVRTRISRSVIDVNRDPSGASLYPGQATTELCPTTTFDGDPLYREGQAPDDAEITRRRERYFKPYHDALREEVENAQRGRATVVLYEAHSIRSRVPRLFDGELPQFNIGTNDGKTCAPELTTSVEAACAASKNTRVVNGRFKGGWTTRHYGRPGEGVHAIQMELACRGYMDEPDAPTPENWPPPYSEDRAAELREVLKSVIVACVNFAQARS